MKKIFCCFCCFGSKISEPKNKKNQKRIDSSNSIKQEDGLKKSDDESDLKVALIKKPQEEKEEANVEVIKINQDESTNNSNDNKYSKNGINLSPEIDDNELILREGSPLICDFEKSVTFNKRGLAETFERMWNLEGYRKIWEKENLVCEICSEGSPFSKEFGVCKFGIRHHKSELGGNGEVPILMQFFYNPNIRTLWDTNIKSLERYEGTDSLFVINTWAKPPVFFMSERDAVEKKLIFDYQGASYVFSSSIPDGVFPENPDVVRIFNYMDYFKLVDEGDYIGYYSLSQSDFKMFIPQMLANMGLPSATKSWFTILKAFASKAKYDKNTKTIIKNKEDDDDDDDE